MKNTLAIFLLLAIAIPSLSQDSFWTSLGDPVLDDLMQMAVTGNNDVLSAVARIEAARQASRATRAGYYPTLGASAGWNQQRTSADMQTYKGHSQTLDYFSLGLSMSWEIDLFGRIAAQSKEDAANYTATVADYEGVLVTLRSNLAKAYFQLRTAQAEMQVAAANVATSEELLRIARTRYEVGLVPAVDVLQAQIAVNETKATVPALKAQVTTSINQLAILTARQPDELSFLRESAPLPASPMPAIVEDTQSLIESRPDIIAARKQLEATEAQVSVAKKSWLPSLSVSAGVGTEAHNFKNLFGSGSLYYSVMPSLSWTIFDGLSRNAHISEAKAELEAQKQTYNLTLLTAIGEAENAMAQWQSCTEQGVLYRLVLNDARKELELQVDRYKQGLCDFTDVANAQSTRLQYEDSVIEAQARQLEAAVTLYTALGGNWN